MFEAVFVWAGVSVAIKLFDYHFFLVAHDVSIYELATFGEEIRSVGVFTFAGEFPLLYLALVAATAPPLQVTFLVHFVLVPVASVAFIGVVSRKGFCALVLALVVLEGAHVSRAGLHESGAFQGIVFGE